jgi:transcriptional regulator with XRE-family HTH domain
MALAERIGLHFTFVSSVERGERNLSLASLLALADGLDADLGELLSGLRR